MPSGAKVLSASMSERELQEHVVSMAKALGWLVNHAWDSRRSESGLPDLVMARRGTVLLAELKTERGTLSPAQWEWQHAATAELWRPSDLLDGTIERALR